MTLSRTDLLSVISNTTGAFGTGSYSPSAFATTSSSLLVVAVMIGIDTGTGGAFTDITVASSPSLTFTRQAGAESASGTFDSYVAIFTAPVTSGASTTLTVDAGSINVAAYVVQASCYTGYNTGSPVGATATANQNSGFTGPPSPFSMTLSGAPATDSEVFAAFGADKVSATTTEGSGWTQVLDGLLNTDWSATGNVEVRTGSTSTTVAWDDLRPAGGSLFTVAGAAVEIKAAAGGGSNTTPGPLVVGPKSAWSTTRPTASIKTNFPLGNPAVPTPKPLVVTRPYVVLPVPGAIIRTNFPLGNPAVPTPQPLVVTAPWSVKIPGAILSSAPATPVVFVATPQPLVVTAAWIPKPTSVILGAAPATQVVFAATPQPLVVTGPYAAPVPGAHLLASPATSIGTPDPLVIVPPWAPVVIPKTYLSWSYPLGNPAVRSPQPLVVGPPHRWPAVAPAAISVSHVIFVAVPVHRATSAPAVSASAASGPSVAAAVGSTAVAAARSASASAVSVVARSTPASTATDTSAPTVEG